MDLMLYRTVMIYTSQHFIYSRSHFQPLVICVIYDRITELTFASPVFREFVPLTLSLSISL